MRKRQNLPALKTIISLALLLFLAQACTPPQNAQPDITPTPIFLQPEQSQEIEPTPFASITPSLSDAPTATQQPSTSPNSTPADLPPANPTTISFRPGGTTAYDSGEITSGHEISYIVNASEGQTMIIAVSSDNNDVYLAIQGVETGQTMLSPNQHKSDWTGTLPTTQGYLITLSTDNPAENYFVRFEIPADIHFIEGAYSIIIDGYIDVHKDRYPDLISHVGYLAYGTEGQIMTINITSPNIDSLSLGIYGQNDKQPYKHYQVKGTSGTFELPATQGYYINIYSIDGVSTEFTLEVGVK